MSKINGLDDSVANRLRFVEPKWSFLAGAEYAKKRTQPNVKMADDSIKNVFVKDPTVCSTFAQMVCLAFRNQRPVAPSCVVQQNEEWLDAEDITEVLGSLFNVTAGGIVTCTDFHNACVANAVLRNVSQNKITRTLKTVYNIDQKRATVLGKNQRCYWGIELTTNENIAFFDDFF